MVRQIELSCVFDSCIVVTYLNIEFAKCANGRWQSGGGLGEASGVNQNCIVKEKFFEPPHQ